MTMTCPVMLMDQHSQTARCGAVLEPKVLGAYQGRILILCTFKEKPVMPRHTMDVN